MLFLWYQAYNNYTKQNFYGNGNTHTIICIYNNVSRKYQRINTSTLHMKSFAHNFLTLYLSSYKPIRQKKLNKNQKKQNKTKN